MIKNSSKKIAILIIIFLIMIVSTNVQAKLVQTFEIVNTKEVKLLENEQGMVTKEILQINKEQKQIDMQIKLENTFDKDTQIVFVIDNSTSMGTRLENNQTRKQKVISTTKELVSQLFKGISNSKIGVVQFSDSASAVNELTDDENALIAKLSSFGNSNPSGSTNIVSGIQVAKNMYSSDAKQKVMIILTDGVPTNTPQDVNSALVSTKDSGVSIFTGIIDIEQASNLAQCFGTVDAPIAGRLYDIKSTTITEIAKEIQEIIQKETSGTIYDIKIEDYFPQEIIENFTIKIGEPTKGTVTDKILSDKEILWEIDELARGESATLPFSLIGKEQESINKNLKTNEDFILTYKDGYDKEYKVQLNSQPEIKVSTEGTKDETNNGSNGANGSNNGSTNKNQNGAAEARLPQTGEEPLGLILIAIVAILVQLGIHYRRYKKMS